MDHWAHCGWTMALSREAICCRNHSGVHHVVHKPDGSQLASRMDHWAAGGSGGLLRPDESSEPWFTVFI